MESRVNFAVVGTFVLVLGAALIGGVLWLSSSKHFGRSYDTYLTNMTESVAGLNLNSPVKYRGVDVGYVREIALNPTNVEEVQLTLEIQRGTPVKEDTIAVLQTQGLTGIAYVELTGGRNDSPILRASPGELPVIKSGPSLLTRLDTAVDRALGSLTRASDSLNALLDEDNRRAIKRTLADLEVLSRTLAARSASIDAGLADAARTMKNTAAFTGELPHLVQRIERSAEAFDRMTTAVAGAGTSATRTIDNTGTDIQRFASDTLPEVRQLVVELRDLASTLRRVGSDIERDPSVLLRGRPPPARRGPGE
jgi:phospholipid/cholesterol/gamma-HCH transport system substrate-binding protein